LYGCELHEGFVNPCIIFGADRGELLYALGVMGWFMLVTLPIGCAGVVASLILFIILFIMGRKKRSSGA
jgi:hypothetical protein